MTEGVIVVSAAKDAAHAASLVSLRGIGSVGDQRLERFATPRQEIYMPGGGRSTYAVETLAAAVTDPSDISVEASTEDLSLSPGESTTIDVEVARNERYQQGVNLAVVLQHLGGIHGNPLPPGVTVVEAESKTLLGPKENQGKIVLKVAPDAPACENVPITIMGHVSINFVVKTAYASKPIRLTVKPKSGL
jgi:hypothetical protein